MNLNIFKQLWQHFVQLCERRCAYKIWYKIFFVAEGSLQFFSRQTLKLETSSISHQQHYLRSSFKVNEGLTVESLKPCLMEEKLLVLPILKHMRLAVRVSKVLLKSFIGTVLLQLCSCWYNNIMPIKYMCDNITSNFAKLCGSFFCIDDKIKLQKHCQIKCWILC